MAGYKVMLRIFAIIIILGVVGFGIYFFAFGGFSNSKAAYSTHKELENSEARTYLRSIDTTSEQMILIGNYGSVEQDGDDYVYFSHNVKAYIALDYVLNEMGDELYYAPKNASGKKQVESKYSAFSSATKEAHNAFKVFFDSYSLYKSVGSAQGESLSEWEQNQLSGFAKKVYPAVGNLVQKAYELNVVCFDYIVKNCYSKSVVGNLKFAMLDATRGQAMTYREAIVSRSELAKLDAYSVYCKKAIEAYKNEKSALFDNELYASNPEFAFKNSFFTLSGESLKKVYQSTNKQEFVDSLQEGAYKSTVNEICTVMGWLI